MLRKTIKSLVMRIGRIGDAMTDHYDPFETSGPAEREADLFSWLTDVLREAMAALACAERLKCR